MPVALFMALVVLACSERVPTATATPSAAPAASVATSVQSPAMPSRPRSHVFAPAIYTSPSQAAELIRREASATSPLLFPEAALEGWTAELRVEFDGFSVWLRAPAGENRSVLLATVMGNAPMPGPRAQQAHPSFRADTASFYQVDDGDDPRSQRELIWDERGVWAEFPGRNAVAYYLVGRGLTDEEFWQIANSLRPL